MPEIGLSRFRSGIMGLKLMTQPPAATSLAMAAQAMTAANSSEAATAIAVMCCS
jgi:hypothetical protein